MQSLLAQTLGELEIVLVDDGSTDRSGVMCDGWAEKDTRISVYHKPNGGLMSAWKYGVERAQGEYVGFVDSDDWVDPDAFERLYAMATEHGAELVTGGLIKENGTRERVLDALPSGFYDRAAIEERILPRLIVCGTVSVRGILPSRVTKLFARSLILRAMAHCDESVSMGEDLLTTFSCFLYAERVFVSEGFAPYHYRLNTGSITQTYSEKKYERLGFLRAALTRAATNGGFDFSAQIDCDYVGLMLDQLECEILFSGKTRRALKDSLRLHAREILPLVRDGALLSKFSKKQRLYLFLLKHRLYGAMIALRRAKRS